MIRCYVRVSRTGNSFRRPHGFWPGPCVESLFGSLVISRVATRCTVIAPDVATAGLVRPLIPAELDCAVVVSGIYGNSESYYYALMLALDEAEPADMVYMVEDDYLHSGPIGDFIVDGYSINPAGYITLYDDPLYYFLSEDVPAPERSTVIHVGSESHWCDSSSTTMTFAAAAWVLRRDWRLHCECLVLNSKPRDREMWDSLGNEGRRLIRRIPGAASHVEMTAAGMYSDTFRPDTWRGALGSRWNTTNGRTRDTPLIMCSRSLRRDSMGTVARYGEVIEWCDDEHVFGLADYAVITAANKAQFDSFTRARAHPIRAVFIEDMKRGSRLYGGRDYPLEMIEQVINRTRLGGEH